MAGSRNYDDSQSLNLMLGSCGFRRIVSGTGTVTANFCAVQAGNNEILTFASGTAETRGDGPGTDALGAGQIVWSPFTAVDIASGVAYAYYDENQ